MRSISNMDRELYFPKAILTTVFKMYQNVKTWGAKQNSKIHTKMLAGIFFSSNLIIMSYSSSMVMLQFHCCPMSECSVHLLPGYRWPSPPRLPSLKSSNNLMRVHTCPCCPVLNIALPHRLQSHNTQSSGANISTQLCFKVSMPLHCQQWQHYHCPLFSYVGRNSTMLLATELAPAVLEYITTLVDQKSADIIGIFASM